MVSFRSIALVAVGAATGTGVSLLVAALWGGTVPDASRLKDPVVDAPQLRVDKPRRRPIDVTGREDWGDDSSPHSARSASPSGSAVPSSEVSPMERHLQAIAAHKASPVDETWARAAQTSVATSLDKLAARSGFSVNTVECRSSSCLAEIGWPSYHGALSTYENLLVEPYEPNCATEIVLPDPADQGAAYSATLVLDCSGAR